MCACVRVYLCTSLWILRARTRGHELSQHPGEEQAEEARPERGAREEREGEEDSRGSRLTAEPKPRREQETGHREDGASRLTGEGHKGRVNREEEGEDDRGARLDDVTEEEGDGDHGRAEQGGDEACEKVGTAKNIKEDGGEVGIRDVGTERGMLAFDNVEGIQREARFGIGERQFAETDEAQSEGKEEGEDV